MPEVDECGYPEGVMHAHVEQCHRAERATMLRELEEAPRLPEPAVAADPLTGRPWCRDCGPGYRLGDDGCRHDNYEPVVGETGICRTCALPIWWETGEVGGREVLGWSDRIARGGDSAVCFKAVGYRHVPMGARDAAIYGAGLKAGQEVSRG